MTSAPPIAPWLTGFSTSSVGRSVAMSTLNCLPLKSVLYPVVVDGAPLWERAFVYLLYPVVAQAGWLAASNSHPSFSRRRRDRSAKPAISWRPNSPDAVRDSLAGVDRASWISCSPPSPRRLVFPPRYGAMLPALDALPDDLKNFVGQMRARRAGRLVLDTYDEARPHPQAPMPARGNGRPLSSLILAAWPQRIAAKAAAAYGHVIRISGFALAIRWNDVEDILRRDLDFQIAPINGPRIDEVNGPFVLGLDRGAQMVTERPQLYAAVSAIDLAGVRALVAREAERLLDDAIAAHGRVDIVNGYARLVAARVARQIFGLAAPTEMDLMRVIRAVFQHTFLNLTGDEAVRQRALAAADELRQVVHG